jgi:hypothetical protein
MLCSLLRLRSDLYARTGILKTDEEALKKYPDRSWTMDGPSQDPVANWGDVKDLPKKAEPKAAPDAENDNQPPTLPPADASSGKSL